MKQPPSAYFDGCTLAPNRLGKISHRDICDDHDRAYWFRRTLLDKFAADARWFVRIIWRHRFNWPWQPVALLLSIVGWIGLTVIGSVLWKYRHRWDR